MIQYITVFIVAAITDLFWTRYIQATADNKAIPATIYSGLIMGLGIYNILNYTENHWTAIPIILGAMVGTYVTIKYKDSFKNFF